MYSDRKRLGIVVLWALLAAFIVSRPVAVQAQRYRAVFLSSTDEVYAQAQAISGLRAVGFGMGDATDWSSHALAWETVTGRTVDLHPASEDYWDTYALDASLFGAAGYGIYSYFDDSGFYSYPHALLWTGPNYTMTDLHPDGYLTSYANGIWGLSTVGKVESGDPDDWENWVSHAYLWPGPWRNGIDLQPEGYLHSSAEGIWGLQIVGQAFTSTNSSHAFLWQGLNRTPVDIHPTGFTQSLAVKVFDGRIVGWGQSESDEIHALAWQGPGHTAVDIHPGGFTSSEATNISLMNVVGFAVTPTPEGYTHAIVWRGSSFTPVDLHQFLPATYLASQAYGTDLLGNIVGEADGQAVLWVPVCN